MTINELRSKRAKLWEGTKAFLETHRRENGTLSAEDDATYTKMEQEISDLGREISRLERQEAMDAELSKPVNTPITTRPGAAKEDTKTGRASDAYRKNFWNAMRSKTPDKSITDALQIGTDSEGGYLIPDEFERTLLSGLEENNIFRTLANIIQTTSGDRKIPIVASHGSAAWVDEEGAIPESDDAFGQITLGAHKVASIIKVSDELLQDSVFDVEGYIATEFARRVGDAEEAAFINGDGSGKPYGMLHDTNGAATGVTAASATALTADELIDLVYSLKAPYRKRALFLFNDQTIKAIRKLKDGNGQFLWQPGLQVGQPNTLLGYRYETSTHMPLIGAGAKPVLFGDMSSYWIADREARSIKRLNELYASTGQIGFRVTQRLDARLVQQEGMKCLTMKAGT